MRLSLATLSQAGPSVARPAYDPAAVTIGIVHFGPGAFHRAHQAAYLDALLASDPRWGICGVSLKSPGVRDALVPQDGLYTLVQLDAETRLQVIGSLREVLVASEAPQAVLARLANPATRLVTLTVTEKGYCLDSSGSIEMSHADIAHDIAQNGAPPRSVIGWLTAGLKARRSASLPPFTVLSCDNLTDNGAKLARAVAAFARATDPALADWIEAEVRFPSSMVDAITPATDDFLRARAAKALGLEDAWPIQREAFTQWVVEDDLGAAAPDLASVGVTLTDDVSGFERAKLRLLNGAHSTLAYLGLLKGHATVAEAMGDPILAKLLELMMLHDIIPTLTAPRGLDLPAYAAAILARFHNPAIAHKLSQIAWDGSQKLPFRLLGVITDRLAAGADIARPALGLAAWMRFIERQAAAGLPVIDPLADTLKALHGPAGFLALEAVFPRALSEDARFRAAVETAYASLPA